VYNRANSIIGNDRIKGGTVFQIADNVSAKT
jgi:hypothetical protein